MLNYNVRMGEEILKDLQTRLEKVLDAIKKDLSSVRTGRAKPSVVEDVKVELDFIQVSKI